jgi:hypothetical protein
MLNCLRRYTYRIIGRPLSLEAEVRRPDSLAGWHESRGNPPQPRRAERGKVELQTVEIDEVEIKPIQKKRESSAINFHRLSIRFPFWGLTERFTILKGGQITVSGVIFLTKLP